MDKVAILALLTAKPGKEQEVEAFLKSAQPLAVAEPATTTWYAVKLGPSRFGIFDSFPNEAGRDAHLTGPIAKALMARAVSSSPTLRKSKSSKSLPEKPRDLLPCVEHLFAMRTSLAVPNLYFETRKGTRRQTNPWLCPSAFASLLLLCSPFVQRSRRTVRPPGLQTSKSPHPTRSLWRRRPPVDFAPGPLDMPVATVLDHIHAAASAIVAYYGRFPVARARMLVVPVAGETGIFHGTTWPSGGGFDAFTRIHIGQHTTAVRPGRRLDGHPRTRPHGLPQPSRRKPLDGRRPGHLRRAIARVPTGELEARGLARMVRGMPKGEPAEGRLRESIIPTPGGEPTGAARSLPRRRHPIRRETQNRKSLQDALRAIVDQGGTSITTGLLSQALAIGDRATGTHILTPMYAQWKDKPVPVDLPKLWRELGVSWTPGGPIEFVSSALPGPHPRID